MSLTAPIVRFITSLVHWAFTAGFWLIVAFVIALALFMLWIAWRNIKTTMEERKARLEHEKFLESLK